MLRPLMRKISLQEISAFASSFKFNVPANLIPPPEFATLPKVGLFTGGYEMFRDFAMV